jgi:hypothetical protein
MTKVSMLRASALTVVLAAGALLIQGCASDQTMTAQGTRMIGASGVAVASANSAPYSSEDWNAALDAAMTSDNGGE